MNKTMLGLVGGVGLLIGLLVGFAWLTTPSEPDAPPFHPKYVSDDTYSKLEGDVEQACGGIHFPVSEDSNIPDSSGLPVNPPSGITASTWTGNVKLVWNDEHYPSFGDVTCANGSTHRFSWEVTNWPSPSPQGG